MIPQDNQADLLQGRNPAASTTAPDALHAQVNSLRTLFTYAVLALIFLSFGVNIFVWRQMSIVRHQLNAATGDIEKYKQGEPMVREFLVKLEGFAAVNRDFQPILSKYVTPRPPPPPAIAPKPPGK